MAKRQRCFMEIEVGGVAMGKITMELFNDKCPRTCENFRALCTGEKGIGKTTEKPLHYLTSIFHRVVNGFMIQGGDFSNGNGTGGESIYGGVFSDEDLATKHDTPFLLSMANRGKDTNGSQFFITTNPTPHLDGIHVVFGQIKTGEDIVKYIEGLPVDRMCRPMQDVKITRCGELVLKNKTKSSKKKKRKHKYVSSSDSTSSDSDEETSPIKSLRKPAAQEVNKILESSEKKSEDEDIEVHPLVTISKIDPADIPEIPNHRLLLRGAPDVDKSRTGHNRPTNSSSGYNQRRQNRYAMVTKSGRHIKGRGKFRFRTPSPSNERSRERSRSATPPHWRQAQKNTIKMSEYKKIVQTERTNREKNIFNRAAQSVLVANGTENGSVSIPKRSDSNGKTENAQDLLNKNKLKSEFSQLKQSVELVFVKASRNEEKLELQRPELNSEVEEFKEPEKNPESPQLNVSENKEGTGVKKEAKYARKSEEKIVKGLPLDLNALDYEVTEFEQAESEHSNENEEDIETGHCTVDKDVVLNDSVDIPSATVLAVEMQTCTPDDKLISQVELKIDTNIKDLPKKEESPSKPVGLSTVSSKQSSRRSSSRTRRSNSRTRRSNSRTKRSGSRTRKTRRGSGSSDRRQRHSGGRSSKHDRERKYDRQASRHGKSRRSRSGDRRTIGVSSRRRRSSSSGSSSSRRHRTRR